MTKPDFSTLSAEELETMTTELRKTMIIRHQDRLKREIQELKDYATSKGFLVEEIFADREPHLVPKFRHPKTPDLTWSGRGRRPDWLNTEIRKGKTLDDFRIT